MSLPQWGRIWNSTSKISRCVVQRATAFQILLFWYRTPEILHRFNPSLSPLCWRCGKTRVTHYHIFWQCELITSFWTMAMSLLQRLFESPLPLNPLHLLLGLPFPGLGEKQQLRELSLYVGWPLPLPLNVITEIPWIDPMTALVEDVVDRFDGVWELWDKSEYGSPPGPYLVHIHPSIPEPPWYSSPLCFCFPCWLLWMPPRLLCPHPMVYIFMLFKIAIHTQL